MLLTRICGFAYDWDLYSMWKRLDRGYQARERKDGTINNIGIATCY